jgi:long-chain fatty acid transport protein
MRAKRLLRRLAACAQAVTLLMLVPTLTHAGGFALYEYGAKANAMGGANIALADDASAVAYNPAGITQLPGTNVMVGMTAIAPAADVRVGADATTSTQTNVYLPPHAFFVHQAGERAWIGIGMFTRFGVGTQYPYQWTGKTNVYRAELSTYSLAPNLALKLTDSLSVAFGPEIMFSSADLRNITAGHDQRIMVDGIGIGGQIALHYKFDDQWSAGFTYHFSQKHNDNGNVKWQESAAPVLMNGDISMSLTLPASWTLGIAYKPNKKWKLEADAIFTEWQSYDKLVYSYEHKPAGTASGDIVSWKSWRNVWRFQLGGEYMATDWLALRAGFVWDQDPMRKGYEDYMLPSNDRKIYSAGFGIISDKMTYDFSLAYLRNNDRSIDTRSGFTGGQVTNSCAYLAGFSIGYKF